MSRVLGSQNLSVVFQREKLPTFVMFIDKATGCFSFGGYEFDEKESLDLIRAMIAHHGDYVRQREGIKPK